MNIFHAVILGMVEGVTEFLPISSTAHLALVSNLLGLSQTEYIKTFEIAIQSGSILAVVVFFWHKFWDSELLKKLFIAFLPTGILGLALYKIIKTYLIGNEMVSIIALALGGLVMIIFEMSYRQIKISQLSDSVTYKQAFLVGLFQSIAMIPGVSRSGATTIGGMTIGIPRETIVEFSFLLAVPTMLAATGLDVLKNLHLFSSSNIYILGVGFSCAFISGLFSINFFLSYIKKHTFISFGVYRIILAIVALVLLSRI